MATPRRSFMRDAAAAGLMGSVVSVAQGSSDRKEEQPPDDIGSRRKVPGTLLLHTRSRREQVSGSGKWQVVDRKVKWEVSETAIMLVDIWEDHWCMGAVQRLNLLVPKMNDVITTARNRGVQIIHCPSGPLRMEYYRNHPARIRLARCACPEPTTTIGGGPLLASPKEPPLPIDDSDGGCDCAFPCQMERTGVKKGYKDHPWWRIRVERPQWRMHQGIDVMDEDGITECMPEIYRFCQQEGIKNMAVMGIHTNMCIANQPFSMRALRSLGYDLVLVRDLTDAMYNPRMRPYVSHTRGTELVVEHYEKHLWPSIESTDLIDVVPGSDDPAS